ncbi:MAG TPA: alcohol dehydrogenase catalytic domain-containing protein [Solirubrobacteraceae bacterium]|nr:alcohol dehydrogenase catalytic domain-containing protein [Solirubrobacteraceae bacterium]
MTAGAAARLHGIGDVRVAEEPVRAPGPGETLVRVEAVGLCGSDLHWWEEGGIGDARLIDPVVPGHEFAGVVEGGPLDGRRVAVDPAVHCGRCTRCLEGHQNLCSNVVFAGHGSCDGGLREYLSWPTEALHPLPVAMDGISGALLEPLGVAIFAVDLGHVHLGTDVAVIGCGPIGLLLIQVARAAGARVVLAVEPLAHRRAAAERAGAEQVVAPEDVGTQTEVDVAFDAAGSDTAVGITMQVARPGARVVLAGIPSDDRTSFSAALARRKGLTIVMVRRMNAVYPRAIRLMEQGLVDLDGFVTHRFPLTRTDEAFTVAAARTGLKVVVEPGA